MYVRRWVSWARAGLGVDGGKGETAFMPDGRCANRLERRDERRLPQLSPTAKDPPIMPKRPLVIAGRPAAGLWGVGGSPLPTGDVCPGCRKMGRHGTRQRENCDARGAGSQQKPALTISTMVCQAIVPSKKGGWALHVGNVGLQKSGP